MLAACAARLRDCDDMVGGGRASSMAAAPGDLLLCPALPCPALPCPALPCPAWPCLGAQPTAAALPARSSCAQVWVDLGGGTGENVDMMSSYIDLAQVGGAPPPSTLRSYQPPTSSCPHSQHRSRRHRPVPTAVRPACTPTPAHACYCVQPCRRLSSRPSTWWTCASRCASRRARRWRRRGGPTCGWWRRTHATLRRQRARPPSSPSPTPCPVRPGPGVGGEGARAA